MAIMAIISHILSAWFAFLLPSYETFKAFSHRPLSEPEVDKWIMYWVVVGAFVAFTYLTEWALSWFPFYWELKTIFLLFLSLPQTQGSTFVYQAYVQPYLAKNEADLDAGIQAAKTNTVTFVQTHATSLYETLWGIVSKQAASHQQGGASDPDAPAPKTISAVAVESAMNLWRSYGPVVIGAINGQSKAPSSDIAPPSAGSSSWQASNANAVHRPPRTPELEMSD